MAASQDIDWMRNMGESKPKPKQKGFLSGLFSTSPEEKARRKAEKARRKAEKARRKAEKARRKSQKQIAKNMRKMENKRKKCKKKGMRLSLNGKNCEEITPQPSSTAYSNNRASIGRDGEAAYLKSLILEQQTRNAMEANTDDESDWSDDDVTDADILAAKRALGKVGGKRRRKRRRKTRRKKKRKSRRKSRKRRRKRKTKRRR